MSYNLAGPDEFLRNTIVVQETEDSWPIVYVWGGVAHDTKSRLVRWVFKQTLAEQQTVWWDTYKSRTGETRDKPPQDHRELTYEEWWAFIYYLITKEAEGDSSVSIEQQFYEEVLQPQTSKEKSNV